MLYAIARQSPPRCFSQLPLIFTSSFRELASPFEPDRPVGPPTPEDMQRLLTLSAKHNYWIASPEESAAIGLNGLFAPGVRD